MVKTNGVVKKYYLFNHPKLDILFLGLFIVICPISTALSGIVGDRSLSNYVAIIYCLFSLVRLLFLRKIRIIKECTIVYIYLLYAIVSFLWNPFFLFDWYFVTFFFTVAIVFLSSLLDYTDKDYHFLNGCIVVSFIVSLLAFVFNIHHLYAGRILITISSTMDPNDFGGGLSLILSYLLFQLSKTKRKLLILPILIVALMMIMTGSRGSIIMFLSAIIVWLFFIRGRIKVIHIVLIFVIIAISIFFVEKFLPDTIIERLSVGALLTDQGSGRLGIWKAAWQRFSQFNRIQVLFGSGHGSFANTVAYRPGGRLIPYRAHNIFVNELIEGGIVGELLLVLCLMKLLIRSYNNRNLLGFLIIVCFIVEGLSLDVQAYRIMSLAFFYAILPEKSKQSVFSI